MVNSISLLKETLTTILEETFIPANKKDIFINQALQSVTHSNWSAFYVLLNKYILDKKDKEKDILLIQLIFLCTDMMDDLVDDDYTFHELSNNHAYIISYLIIMYVLKNSDYNRECLIELFTQSGIGECQDVDFIYNPKSLLTEEDYLHMVSKKSGTLSKMIGVITSKDRAIHEFMYYIGIAQQIKNDLNDITNPKKNDFINKKMYLPLIKYIQYSNDNDLVDCSRESIINSGAIDYCKLMYIYYTEYAFDILIQRFPYKKDSIGEMKDEFII